MGVRVSRNSDGNKGHIGDSFIYKDIFEICCTTSLQCAFDGWKIGNMHRLFHLSKYSLGNWGGPPRASHGKKKKKKEIDCVTSSLDPKYYPGNRGGLKFAALQLRSVPSTGAKSEICTDCFKWEIDGFTDGLGCLPRVENRKFTPIVSTPTSIILVTDGGVN